WWATAVEGLDCAAIAGCAEHAHLLGLDRGIASAGVRSTLAADRRPIDLRKCGLQTGDRPDLQHRAGPGDAIRVVLVVPPLGGRALNRDAVPAVGLEDRRDIHTVEIQAEHAALGDADE